MMNVVNCVLCFCMLCYLLFAHKALTGYQTVGYQGFQGMINTFAEEKESKQPTTVLLYEKEH